MRPAVLAAWELAGAMVDEEAKREVEAKEQRKRRKCNSRLLLFVRRETQEGVRVEKAISL